MKYFSVGFLVALLCMGGVSMAAAPGTDGDPTGNTWLCGKTI